MHDTRNFGTFRAYGATLVEMLIVLGMIGILMSIVAPSLRPDSARVAADSVHGFVQQARFEAVKQNHPVVVSIGPDGVSSARTSNATSIDCVAPTSALRSLSLDDYRGVGLDGSQDAFVWLPTGQPRTCSGAPASTVIEITITGRERTKTVTVRSGGAVSLE